MNTVYTQFQQALKREKQYITTYYDNMQYPCLYRKIDDYSKEVNHIIIFYDVDTPIKQGQLLTYGDKVLIVMNKESVENDIYYKSILKECNLTIPIFIKGVIESIPCYSYELSSAYNIRNNIITFLDGDGELITELIPELSTTNYVDKGFRIMGGYFQVANIHNINNIVHVMITRKEMPSDTYSLYLYSSETSFNEGDTTQIIANAAVNDITDTTATITYSSDNETVATVDSNGLVSFIGAGKTNIEATWVEHNVKSTITFKVKGDSPITYKIVITGDWENNEQMLEIAHTFSATVEDNLGNPVTTTNLVYSVNNFSMAEIEPITILTDKGNGTYTIEVGDFDDTQYIGETFDLICTDTISGTSKSITLTIVKRFY